MVKKSDIKAVAVVTIGVMLAGFVMYQMRDVDIVDKAISGFGG